MSDSLDTLEQAGVLNSLDRHFARLLARLDGAMAPEACLGAALASRAVREGHVCLDLTAMAGTPIALDGRGVSGPALDTWIKALRTSSVVGRPGEFRPLVLDGVHRLYLYRYWDYEQRLVHQLRQRADYAPTVDRELLAAQLHRLFPREERSSPDWQRIAAAVALLRGLCVISGGPGTGKTTTVTRLLAMLVEQAGTASTRIALAAPTGKAAMRLSEAVRAMKPNLDVPERVRVAIPESASTLHRLLGYRPNGSGFRHGVGNPLPVDALVVDEASMIDQAMMVRVAEALPPAARLILLGDKDQLASVEAGAVLGDICAGWRGFSPSFAGQIAAVTGIGAEALPAGDARVALEDTIVELRMSHRFSHGSGIGGLARSVNAGDGEASLRLLAQGLDDLEWHDTRSLGQTQALLADRAHVLFGQYLAALGAGAAPETVFAAFERVGILCALRSGPLGVAGVNRLVEEALHRAGLIDVRRPWYAGRPIMVARNDYGLRLFNGDIGLLLPGTGTDGEVQACFRDPNGGIRRLSPSRLPAHQTCYALTVHKSQGSEFDEVLTVLPQEDTRVLGRELLYTAVTRARRKVVVAGPREVIAAAVARRTERRSGLRDSLWVAGGPAD
ncbi:MAG: exodeoxyribonuclease V subunit alpha [Gammaproteobacteria bacterium]